MLLELSVGLVPTAVVVSCWLRRWSLGLVSSGVGRLLGRSRDGHLLQVGVVEYVRPAISLEVAHADGAPIHVLSASGPFQSLKGKVMGGQRLDVITQYGGLGGPASTTL